MVRPTLPDGRQVIWEPASAPQRALLACPVFEVFFGGARGGGKTDGILGEWAQHASQYGENAIGLIVRRTRLQLTETFERAKAIYRPIGAKFTEVPMRALMPGGARLNFAYLERDADAENYQGHGYCVGVGTPIRMADGSFKPIEEIVAGECVATLEGPRRVLETVKPYYASCVKALVRDGRGAVVGDQVHPVWHPVLTTAGLSELRTSQIPQTGWPQFREVFYRGKQDAGSCLDGDQDILGWAAYEANGRSGYRVSEGEPRAMLPRRSLCFPVVLHAPSVRSVRAQCHDYREESIGFRSRGKLRRLFARKRQGLRLALCNLLRHAEHALSGVGYSFPSRANDRAYALNDSRTDVGYQCDYACDRGLYDGHVRHLLEICRDSIPLPNDAGTQRRLSLSDGLGTIQRHSHFSSLCWEHPYTGEARHLSEEVTSGTMELTPIGDALVADLCVEGANHYISETGLINKNTRIYIEEAGNFPSIAPILKLMATLRSGAGVPCRIRLTGNPGGPGHQWIKARYIDPFPQGWSVMNDPDSGLDRVYIPSRVSDNPFLGDDYVRQLKQLGDPVLVRAWLEGDFSVIAGAFFPEFSMDQHVIEPRSLPSYWLRFRSLDWGSARPFSVGWWTVSDGELADFPRGALIRYREWYGSSAPNVGLRLTAEEVADGIKEREKGDIHGNRTMGGVADPAIFAEDGGPSIASRMSDRGIFFRPADNKRVAQQGALGGWDQLRSRLKGDGETPGVFFFSTCRDLIRTLPALQHDPDRPEDVDTDNEDHAPDECRYACMSRPYTPPLPASIEPPERDRYARGWRPGKHRRGSSMAA